MLDIVITGGTAVLPSGAETVDIGIEGEKIAVIGAPGSLAGLGAQRTVDAKGQIVRALLGPQSVRSLTAAIAAA